MSSEGILDPKLLQTYQGHKAPVNGVTYGFDGKLVTCSNDRTVQLWGFRSHLRSLKLMGHRGAVNAVDISPKVMKCSLFHSEFVVCCYYYCWQWYCDLDPIRFI